jgi:sulfate permease, SulP family
MSPSANRLINVLAAEFRPANLARSLLAGVTLYISEIFVVLSFAALIFSGELSGEIAYGVGFIVSGDAALCLLVALLSTYRGSIAIAQDAPGAILALAAASLVASLPVLTRSQQALPTVVVMIVCASLATGLFFILLGVFKLGGLARYLPYPVLGGFLAGTGWLLAAGGVGVMINTPFHLGWFTPAVLLQWLPGLIIGVLIYFLTDRLKNPLVLPLSFLAAVGLFYLSAWLAGASVAGLKAGGWLLGPLPERSLWMFPLSPQILSQVNWPALAGQIPNLAPILLVSTIALLLNANSVELVIHKDLDLNHELTIAGVGNAAAGLVGGTPGYHAISLSMLNHEITGGRRLAGVCTAGLLCLTVFFGAAFLSYIPKMALGAMLVFLGFSLLMEWVYRAWFTFTRLDFLIVLAILVIIAWKGFLLGIAVGVVLTIVLFVINYSQINVVKQALSGAVYRSRVHRSRRQWESLAECSEALYILRLQGYIFFGTAYSLFQQIQRRCAQADAPPVRWVILDFAQVSGLDSTGLLSFKKLLQLAIERGFLVLLTGLASREAAQFSRAGLGALADQMLIFSDIDHGFEWCEDQILRECVQEAEPTNLFDQLLAVSPEKDTIQALLPYLERKEIGAGEYLMRRGDEPDWLYFVESGQVTAQITKSDGEIYRLESMRGGNVVGELGLILDIPRTADVAADLPSVVYGLSKTKMAEIEQSDPVASSALHTLIAKMLGERVVKLTKILDAMER